jgi:hypothetical protein
MNSRVDSSSERYAVIESRFAEARGIVRRVLQHAVAAAVLIFYSRNVMSAAIRTLFGA